MLRCSSDSKRHLFVAHWSCYKSVNDVNDERLDWASWLLWCFSLQIRALFVWNNAFMIIQFSSISVALFTICVPSEFFLHWIKLFRFTFRFRRKRMSHSTSAAYHTSWWKLQLVLFFKFQFANVCTHNRLNLILNKKYFRLWPI